MRTRFELALFGADRVRLRAAGEAALEEIARVEGELSAFRPDAAIARLNAEAGLGPARVEPVVLALLEWLRGRVAMVEGAFDPTVGALLAALRAGRPGARARDAARRWVGFERHVRLDREAGTVAFSGPGVRLDLGGAGKGYALDRAAELLREAGVARALLHGGTSSVLALGAPPDEPRGFTVAIADPRRPARILGRVRLRDAALSVSSIHGRRFGAGGARAVGHVLDPRSGRPISSPSIALAIGPDGLDAEILSTALLVLGAAAVPRLCRRFPGTRLYVGVRAMARAR